MRISLYFITVILLFFFSCRSTKKDGSTIEEEGQAVTLIQYGTSFGECVGYCKTTLIINSSELVYSKSTWSNEPPAKEGLLSFSSSQWLALTDAIDFAELKNLDATIGCPDCGDGGTEWVEIKKGSETKRIIFEYGENIPELADLLILLRQHAQSIPK